MKVLLINGSARQSCTYTALSEMCKIFSQEGVDYEIVNLGSEPLRDCIGCKACVKLGKCTFDDDIVNNVVEKAKEADAFVFGTPVYYAHPSGRLLSFLDRAFYSGAKHFAFKPATVVASARRAGTTASLDAVMKHITINQMPYVSSTYWNMVHGNTPDEVKQDLEGLQSMRNAAKNMVWMLRCIEAGKAAGIALPDTTKEHRTSFIR